MDNRLTDTLILLHREKNGQLIRKTLFVLVIPVQEKRPLPEARPFLQAHPDYESLTTISERRKWCCYRKNLTRKQVSFLIGDTSGTYSDLETGKATYTPTNLGTHICTLFEIPLSDIQDAYTAFLESGQGQQVRKHRESLHMTESEYAHLLGVRPSVLRQWEAGTRVVSRITWERFFK